jgi:hypothetical protein
MAKTFEEYGGIISGGLSTLVIGSFAINYIL